MRPDTFTKPLLCGREAPPALSLPDAVQVLECELVQPLVAHPAGAAPASDGRATQPAGLLAPRINAVYAGQHELLFVLGMLANLASGLCPMRLLN